MAGDTREPSPPATANPALGQSDLSGTSGSAEKKYTTFEKGPVSANSLPAGSGLNTAGSKLNNDYTLVDAIKTVRLEDFKQVHMYPCVRESLLTGIGAGFGVGGLRAIFGGELPTPFFHFIRQ
jgi:cytochrome c oxidase assembly protein subunit 20